MPLDACGPDIPPAVLRDAIDHDEALTRSARVWKSRALHTSRAHDEYRLANGLRDALGSAAPVSQRGLFMTYEEMFESTDESALEFVSGGYGKACCPTVCGVPSFQAIKAQVLASLAHCAPCKSERAPCESHEAC